MAAPKRGGFAFAFVFFIFFFIFDSLGGQPEEFLVDVFPVCGELVELLLGCDLPVVMRNGRQPSHALGNPLEETQHPSVTKSGGGGEEE